MINTKDILETINMVKEENLDIRTVTMGISLLDCASDDPKKAAERIYDKITKTAEKLVPTAEQIEKEYGIPIINKRVSVTPVSLIGGRYSVGDYIEFAKTLDSAADTLGINFIGGYGALVQKGFTAADRNLIESIPEALAVTGKVRKRRLDQSRHKYGRRGAYGQNDKKDRVFNAGQRLYRLRKIRRFRKRTGGQPVYGGRFPRHGRG